MCCHLQTKYCDNNYTKVQKIEDTVKPYLADTSY